jgi:hypothetical protein
MRFRQQKTNPGPPLPSMTRALILPHVGWGQDAAHDTPRLLTTTGDWGMFKGGHRATKLSKTMPIPTSAGVSHSNVADKGSRVSSHFAGQDCHGSRQREAVNPTVEQKTVWSRGTLLSLLPPGTGTGGGLNRGSPMMSKRRSGRLLRAGKTLCGGRGVDGRRDGTTSAPGVFLRWSRYSPCAPCWDGAARRRGFR